MAAGLVIKLKKNKRMFKIPFNSELFEMPRDVGGASGPRL